MRATVIRKKFNSCMPFVLTPAYSSKNSCKKFNYYADCLLYLIHTQEIPQ